MRSTSVVLSVLILRMIGTNHFSVYHCSVTFSICTFQAPILQSWLSTKKDIIQLHCSTDLKCKRITNALCDTAKSTYSAINY